MKKSLFPALFLIMAFVVVLMADDSLFEGIFMTERLLNTNTVNKASAILQAGSASLPTPNGASLILTGTNGVGTLTLRALNSAGSEHASLQASSANLLAFRVMGTTLMEYGPNATQVEMGQSGSQFQLNSSNFLFGSGKVAFGTAATPSMVMSSSGATSNFFGFVDLTKVTSPSYAWTAGTLGSVLFVDTGGLIAQNNSDFFFDATNKRLGIGINSGLLAKIHVLVTNGVSFSYMGDSYSSTSTDDSAGFIGRRARGTVAVPTAVTTGDILARFSGRGYGTTVFGDKGRGSVQVEASETFTDTAQGARLLFYTTPVTTTNTTEAMRIHNDGSVGIGTNTIVATVKLDVNGPLQVEGPAIITSSAPITNIIGSVSGLIPSMYVTNVSADFPSTLTLAGADLNFAVPSTILTNSVVTIGRPSTEVTGLVTVGLMTNAGQVVIRARNVTAGTIDQAALPYRISIQVNPTQ